MAKKYGVEVLEEEQTPEEVETEAKEDNKVELEEKKTPTKEENKVEYFSKNEVEALLKNSIATLKEELKNEFQLKVNAEKEKKLYVNNYILLTKSMYKIWHYTKS